MPVPLRIPAGPASRRAAIASTTSRATSPECARLLTAVNPFAPLGDGYTSAMLPLGSHPVWHPVFETLAYAAGYAAFRRVRARRGDVIAEPQRWTVLAAAAVGALLGSRVLGLAEQWPTLRTAWQSGHLLALVFSPGGKTIVGGLLGGWLAVEKPCRSPA
ncbi:hypothetical protein DYQ86_14075 [Acidobacteria bacterium AB60]|nr:hypothetical protein DYQ86_14075 [Acidobacteria bacterium AB60]